MFLVSAIAVHQAHRGLPGCDAV